MRSPFTIYVDVSDREWAFIRCAAGVVQAALLAALLGLAACTPLPNPPLEDPTAYPPSSFGAEAGSGTPCERACARLAALHCPEAKPTKSGVACPALCDRAQALEEMPTACVVGAASIPAVRACGVRCAD